MGVKVGWRGSEEIRFWSRVEIKPDGCWEWTGYKTHGYGRFCEGGKRIAIPTHRWAYEFCIGPIPENRDLDHLCRNRACVNPWHLEPVTRGENVLRGNALTAINARKTHCPNGHPFDKVKADGSRACSICMRARDMRFYRRKTGQPEDKPKRIVSKSRLYRLGPEFLEFIRLVAASSGELAERAKALITKAEAWRL